jgi:hypothetical protein
MTEDSDSRRGSVGESVPTNLLVALQSWTTMTSLAINNCGGLCVFHTVYSAVPAVICDTCCDLWHSSLSTQLSEYSEAISYHVAHTHYHYILYFFHYFPARNNTVIKVVYPVPAHPTTHYHPPAVSILNYPHHIPIYSYSLFSLSSSELNSATRMLQITRFHNAHTCYNMNHNEKPATISPIGSRRQLIGLQITSLQQRRQR